MHIRKNFTRALLLCAAAFLLAACGDDAAQQAAMQRPAPVVGYIVTKTEPLRLTTQLPGRTSPFLAAEVRPQVSGILKARLFTEGAEVTAGDILYEIDPAPFEASVNSARAALARSEASLAAAKLRHDRASELVKSGAVGVQEADDASASFKQAQASVAADRAALESARINLDHATVTAPISGKIGRSSVTQGALVTANQGMALATIQQLDPIYVDVTQSSMELLRLRRSLESGQLIRSGENSTEVTLLLEDGTSYAEVGTLQFSEVAVDPSTGSVTLRAVFPNPNKELLPGMFVRAVLEEGVDQQALLVPQEGVTRDFRGQAFVMVVKADNTLEQRPVNPARTIGDKWLITEGLVAGEKVVVEGLMQVRAGMTVRAEPATNRDADGRTTVGPTGVKGGGLSASAADGAFDAAARATSSLPATGSEPATAQ